MADGAGGKPGYAELDGCQDPADPTGKKRIKVFVSRSDLLSRYQHVRSQGFDLITAHGVLKSPERIYEGIRKDLSGWCYAGIPANREARAGVSLPLPPGFVFCAYVNPRGVLFDWRLEKTTLASLDASVGAGKRFRRIAWRKI